MTIDELKSNLTIGFMCYNVKDYLILAIESFLRFYPDFKDNILVFDDNSDDGTREWLDSNNIKWITWDISPDDTVDNKYQYITGVRELIQKVNTKYLLFNHSDVVFLKNGFLESYCDAINTGNDYVFTIAHHPVVDTTTPDYDAIMDFEIASQVEFAKPYMSLWSESDHALRQIYHSHMFLNVEDLKNKNISFDQSYDQKIPLDIGVNFLLQIEQNGVKYKSQDLPTSRNYVYHVTGVHFILKLSTKYNILTEEKVSGIFNRVVNSFKNLIASDTSIQDIINRYNLNLFKFN